MIGRRAMLQALAAVPWLGSGLAAAAAPRVGGARILVQDNRVWIQVRFGTRGPFPFIIDTGADTNLIRRDLALKLGLKPVREAVFRGVGGSQGMAIYQGQEVVFGNAGVGTITFASFGDELPIHPEAQGALSASMLTVADCDLDFDAMEWRIYLDGRGARPGFEALPSSIRPSASRRGATPVIVEAAIGSETYKLQVDTGAPGQISLHSGPTRRSALWDERRPYAPQQRGGIGGKAAPGRLVRAPEVRLGGLRFEGPLVSLADPQSRDLMDNDGLLGLGLIQRMNLSSDVRGGRLWAKRNARPAPPERYGLTGLWVDPKGDGLVVGAVSPASPAAEAGLQVGDEIPGTTVRDFLRRVGGPPGRVVEIGYVRSGRPATARLTLRPFL